MKPTELLTGLGAITGDLNKHNKYWPATTKKLNADLKRLNGDFKKMGIDINKENYGNNLYKITKKPDSDG
ncbi:MAG: hypothetical protein V3U87_11455 [Methylococcaceae bacterium]